MPWVKGQSGNPGGRTKALGEIERLARQHAPEAIAALYRALKDPKFCVAAATALLNRGFGMPSQKLDANINIFDQLGDGAAERIERALSAAIAREEGGGDGAAASETLQ
jgi:HEAT repeat protein